MAEGEALINDRGRIVVTGTATNLPGVFAGGDCVNGGKEVVDAVQAGKDAAAAILEYIAAGGGGSKPLRAANS
jgi:glutamate synthase (NADPH/NADH) small chain